MCETSLSVIQRTLIESGRELLFVDSFDREPGNVAKVTCRPERQVSQCIGPDIVKTTVKFIMACLAGTILHSFHNSPEDILHSRPQMACKCRDLYFIHAVHCKRTEEIKEE